MGSLGSLTSARYGDRFGKRVKDLAYAKPTLICIRWSRFFGTTIGWKNWMRSGCRRRSTSKAKARSGTPTFSLLNLLTLTALIAIGTAVGLTYRKNRSMVQQRDELLSLSSRLHITSEDELASAAMPRVADDFHSWQVHVPDGLDYELRLGIGAVSETGIPPIVGGVRIPAGRHRVTLHTADSPTEEFRYVVYVDGKQAIEKTMGGDWIPGGWSSASGMSWPRGPKLSPAPLELSSRSYKPNLDFGNGNYFNGQSDNYVTRSGYRLWVDQRDRTCTPTFFQLANVTRKNCSLVTGAAAITFECCHRGA